jgi:uncharacterized protein (UPF0261 family)
MNREQIKGKAIGILATLDTRGDEVSFLKEKIEARGHHAVVVDVGVMGTPYIKGDFTREAVARAGGKTLEELVEAAGKGADRKQATDIMIKGAEQIIMNLYADGNLDGVMSLGGTTAAATGVAVMKGLPIGFPKLLITTFIALAPVGEEDLVVMQAPVDLIGLNKVIMQTLSNAAGAVIGMVEQEVPKDRERKLIGITALGVTTPAVQKVISRIEERGYDSIVFHATTAKLNRMANEGVIDAIIDLTAYETVPKVLYSPEQLMLLSGGQDVDRSRLDCAERSSIPQIIAPGGLDMHIWPGATDINTVPPEYKNRAWSMHGPNIVLIRTSKEELEQVGQNIAERANRALGPVSIIIPLQGFSEASRKDAPLCDPDSDRAFMDSVKNKVDQKVKIQEIDCHINDDAFAEAIMNTFDKIIVSGRR